MAHTLPSSSISLESHKRGHPQLMSATEIEPPSPPPLQPYKKQKQPPSPPDPLLYTSPESPQAWPLLEYRDSWVATLAAKLTMPQFDLLRMEEAEAIAGKIEDQAYKAADAAADLSPRERQSMYLDVMHSQINKHGLSESEFSARMESDPRYCVLWDPALPWDRPPQKPREMDQGQLQTQNAEWLATYPQEQQDSGMSPHKSLEAVQAMLSDKDKLAQVLLELPDLLKVLQEKLEQQ